MNQFINSALDCAHPAKDLFDDQEFSSYPDQVAVKDAVQNLKMAALAFLGLVLPQTDNIVILD